MYNDVEKSHGLLMDGGVPTSFDTVLWRTPLLGAAIMPSPLSLGWAQIQFRGTGTPEVGIGGRLHRHFWKAYSFDGEAELTDVTVEAQDVEVEDLPLEVQSDDDSGFLVASPYQFNCLDLKVTVASDGGSAVRVLQYSAPDGWVTIANPLVAPPSAGNYATGETLIWWTIPQDWVPMVAADHGTGVPEGWYGIRVVATTAPSTTAGVADSMSVAVLKSVKDLGANNVYGWLPGLSPLSIDAPCDSLV